jgi:hypothetical protein
MCQVRMSRGKGKERTRNGVGRTRSGSGGLDWVGTGFAVGHGRPPLVLVCGAVERGAAVEVVGGVDVGTSTAAEEAQRGMRECR